MATCFPSERGWGEPRSSNHQQHSGGRRYLGSWIGGATLPPTGEEFSAEVESTNAALMFYI